MAIESYFANNLNRNLSDGKGLPSISQDIDSIRAYQWEIVFHPPAEIEVPFDFSKPLTIAAKSVNGVGFDIEPIEVNRINDKVFYPGKATAQELVVTFDNLLKTKNGFQLYKYIQTVYDPVTVRFAAVGTDGEGTPS